MRFFRFIVFLLAGLFTASITSGQDYFIKGYLNPAQTSIGVIDICLNGDSSLVAVGDYYPLNGFIVKLDRFGEPFYAMKCDTFRFEQILKTSDNNLLVSAHAINSCCSYYVSKLDTMLNVLWSKILPGKPFLMKEFGNSYYFVNRYNLNTNLATKLDQDGNVINQKLIQETGMAHIQDYTDAIQVTPDKLLLLGYRTIQSVYQEKMFLTLIDTGLNVQWMKNLHGFFHNSPSGIIYESDSTYIISGVFTKTSLSLRGFGQIRIDTSGTVLFARHNVPITPNNYMTDVGRSLITSNREIMVASSVIENTGDPKPIIVKYDSALNVLNCYKQEFLLSYWVAMGNFLLNDPDGRIFLTGNTNLNGATNTGFTLTGLDSSLQTCISHPVDLSDTVVTMTITDILFNQPAYTSVALPDTLITFQPFSLSEFVYCQSVGLNELSDNDENLTLFPNPIHDFVYVKYLQKGKIEFFNAMGDLVLYSEITTDMNQEVQFDLSSLPAGIYMVRNGSFSQKFVILH